MLSFFPRDALDKIWDLIESVSAGFPTHSYLSNESEHSFFMGRGKIYKEKYTTGNFPFMGSLWSYILHVAMSM